MTGRIPHQLQTGEECRLPVLLRLCNDTCCHRMTGSTSRDTPHYFIHLERARFDLSAARNNSLPANSERVDGRATGKMTGNIPGNYREGKKKSLPKAKDSLNFLKVCDINNVLFC